MGLKDFDHIWRDGSPFCDQKGNKVKCVKNSGSADSTIPNFKILFYFWTEPNFLCDAAVDLFFDWRILYALTYYQYLSNSTVVSMG